MLLGIVKSISQFLRPKKFPRVVISAISTHELFEIGEHALGPSQKTNLGVRTPDIEFLPTCSKISKYVGRIGCFGAKIRQTRGAFSNLLFSSKANILELFADGHEVRPDYFQLATIKSLSYYYCVSASVNQSNDFFLDLFVLKRSFFFMDLMIWFKNNA